MDIVEHKCVTYVTDIVQPKTHTDTVYVKDIVYVTGFQTDIVEHEYVTDTVEHEYATDVVEHTYVMDIVEHTYVTGVDNRYTSFRKSKPSSSSCNQNSGTSDSFKNGNNGKQNFSHASLNSFNPNQNFTATKFQSVARSGNLHSSTRIGTNHSDYSMQNNFYIHHHHHHYR